MKKNILNCIFLLVFTASSSAQIDSIQQSIQQQEEAIRLATNWTNLIFVGNDIDSLVEISGLPFALDRSDVLNSNEELESFYAEITKNIGKGTSPKLKADLHDSKLEIIQDIIPINVLIIKVTILDGEHKDDTIFLAITISGDDMKINGFSD